MALFSKKHPLAKALAVLPEPTQHGSYWLGSPDPAEAVGAIFRAGDNPGLVRLRGDQVGKFFASTSANGVIFHAGKIRYFASPHQALQAIRESLGVV